MSERSEYRRPPSDVDNMISLRVDSMDSLGSRRGGNYCSLNTESLAARTSLLLDPSKHLEYHQQEEATN